MHVWQMQGKRGHGIGMWILWSELLSQASPYRSAQVSRCEKGASKEAREVLPSSPPAYRGRRCRWRRRCYLQVVGAGIAVVPCVNRLGREHRNAVHKFPARRETCPRFVKRETCDTAGAASFSATLHPPPVQTHAARNPPMRTYSTI